MTDTAEIRANLAACRVAADHAAAAARLALEELKADESVLAIARQFDPDVLRDAIDIVRETHRARVVIAAIDAIMAHPGEVRPRDHGQGLDFDSSLLKRLEAAIDAAQRIEQLAEAGGNLGIHEDSSARGRRENALDHTVEAGTRGGPDSGPRANAAGGES